jgi:hypothetical protein
MTGLPAILFTLLAGFSLLAFLYTRRRGRSLTDLRGPEPSSFWLGILHEFYDLWISDQLRGSQVTRPTFDIRMK